MALTLPTSSAIASVAMFLALACTASALDLKVKADATDALIVGDAPTTVTVSLQDDADERATYELRQQFVDRYGKTTDGPTVRIELTEPWRHQVKVPVEHFGPTTYRGSLYKAGEDEPVARVEQMLIKPVPVPRLSRDERARSPIGINVHTAARWNTLGAMGIHWARDYSWGWLGDGSRWPLAKNGTDFSTVEPDADRAGITILPIMQQAFRTEDKKFFITDADAIAAAYERLSRAVPELKHWELDNEADLAHRDEASEGYKRWYATYLEYVKAADRGLDAAGNGAEVVLNGEAGIHAERTRDLIERVGEHFAVVNYHFYTGTIAPEMAREDINTGSEDRPRTTSFLDQMREVNRIAHDAGKGAWLTEIGWSARSGPAVGDRLQSAYLQRVYLLSRWAGTDKTFWFWDRELKPGGRFSSTELIHKDEGARPAGAAMAAVSKFTALADYAGSVDLGPDRWCLVFERPDRDGGGYLAAAWAVESEHDLPEPLAGATEALGMYGNPLRDRKLTAEPAYFVLRDLPKAWQDQLRVEWVGPQIINVYQGQRADVEVHLPGSGQVAWDGLPAGAAGAGWQGDGERRTAALEATPKLDPGTYPLTAVASGDGWAKRFPLWLKVRPAIDVNAVPYTPGKAGEVTFTNLLDAATEATLSVERGEVEPAAVTLAPGAAATARFTAPADATGPVELTLSLPNGATQRYRVRPRNLDVPRADDVTIDGDLSDWPRGGALAPASLLTTGPAADEFAPRMKLAWSPKGLYAAAEIPVGADFQPPSDPTFFWEWTSVEMSVNATDATAAPDPKRQHLFWYIPTKDSPEGPWRVYAGEWEKPQDDGTKQTIKDDRRPETAMRYDGQTVTIEVLVPAEVLGATPKAGEQWPLTISSKLAKALSPRTVAGWPGGKAGSGWDGRGRVRFVE